MVVDTHALAGPYALNALDVAERAQFERHLATCDPCWVEVLAGMATSERLDAVRPSITP